MTKTFNAWVAAECNVLFVFPLHWKGVVFGNKWMIDQARQPISDLIHLTGINDTVNQFFMSYALHSLSKKLFYLDQTQLSNFPLGLPCLEKM